MASIRKNGKRWRVQMYVHGKRDSASFGTKQEAALWALEREAELSGRKLPDASLGDALKRYLRDVAPTHRGYRWEKTRLRSLGDAPIARRSLATLSANDFANWRDDRMREVAPGTVAREMTLLRSVLESARRDWGWLRVNPMQEVRWPKVPPSRKRRLTDAEVDKLTLAFGQGDGLVADTATQRVGLAFLFALETAMRSGEIVGICWADVHIAEQYVHLPKTKNGEQRDVPLSRRAIEILNVLPKGTGPVFGVSSGSRDALFRKHRGAMDLHFHDTRAEAIWRLSKKLDVLQLARVIGHRNPASLMLYYNESATEMAKRLDAPARSPSRPPRTSSRTARRRA